MFTIKKLIASSLYLGFILAISSCSKSPTVDGQDDASCEKSLQKMVSSLSDKKGDEVKVAIDSIKEALNYRCSNQAICYLIDGMNADEVIDYAGVLRRKEIL